MARSNTEFSPRRVRGWLRGLVELTIALVASSAILYVASIQAVGALRGGDCPAASALSIQALLAPCAATARLADVAR